VQKPRITFDRFGQVFFVFREVVRLAAKTNRKFLVLVLILNAIWGFSTAPGFYLEKLILDNLIASIGDPNWRQAMYLIGGIIFLRLLLELFRNVLSRVNGFLSRKMSQTFASELEIMMAKKMTELDIATIDDPDFKNKYTKIERESGRRAWGLMMPLSDISNYLIGFISVVGILILLHPLIALGVLVFSLPQFFVSGKYIKKEYELETALSAKYRMWGWLTYYLVRNKNFLELKILGISGYLTKKLKSIQSETIDKQMELSKKRELSNFGTFLPLTFYEFAVSVWLIFLVITEKITIGSFELYLRSLRSAESNLTGLVNSVLEIYENYIYVVDLIWFLNLKPVINEKAKTGKNAYSYKRLSLEAKNVWFRYPKSKNWILKGVNMHVNPGEKIALVGENGAGKSTLIKLLARFYDPEKGKIVVAGSDLKDFNLGSYRRRLAILFQKFESYPFTAQESIGYGDISRVNKLGQIKEAAHKTTIDKFIETLPLKYKHPLAPEFDKGVDLSIGQWQRVGISRMLFRKNADILIMDEPTSNVDPKAEEQIFRELLKKTKDKILIFVSQRFSTVRYADRIFVLDKGRITESGTHDELMKLGGLYHELFTIQAKGYQ